MAADGVGSRWIYMVNRGYKWPYRPTENDRHEPKLNQTRSPKPLLVLPHLPSSFTGPRLAGGGRLGRRQGREPLDLDGEQRLQVALPAH